MNKLSNRLKAIVKFVDKKDSIVDVGCDHGKVLAELAKNKAEFLVATDISEPSVKKAEALLTELNFKNFSVYILVSYIKVRVRTLMHAPYFSTRCSQTRLDSIHST